MRTIHVSNRVERQKTFDDEGRFAGYSDGWSDPAPELADIGMPNGSAMASPFGADVSYDRTALLESTSIAEGSRVWVDADPASDPHDFIAKKVSPSLSFTLVALSKTEAS